MHVPKHVNTHITGTLVDLGGLLSSPLLFLLYHAQIIGHFSVHLGNSYKNNSMSGRHLFNVISLGFPHNPPGFNAGCLGVPGKGLVLFTPIA